MSYPSSIVTHLITLIRAWSRLLCICSKVVQCNNSRSCLNSFNNFYSCHRMGHISSSSYWHYGNQHWTRVKPFQLLTFDFSCQSLLFQPDLPLPPTYLPIYQPTFLIIYILAYLHTKLLTHLPTLLPTYPPTFLPTTYAMPTSIDGYNNMKVLQKKLFKSTLVIFKAWKQ
jgi:hypothetical protein